MAFTPSTEVKTVTHKDWGYYQDNAYINNSGGITGGDDYWQIKGAIDVSYEASVGGSFQIGGMTFFESNRTNVNFYSSETVDSSKRISTVYLSSQNQVVSIPSNAKIMVLCVRTIGPDESGTVTVTLRQLSTVWNTSDGLPPKAGKIYDYNGTINFEIGKVYDWDGSTSRQIGKVYDYDGTSNHLIYNAIPDALYTPGNPQTEITGGWILDTSHWPSEFYETGSSLYMRGSGTEEGGANVRGTAIVRTANPVDLSGINTLAFTANGRNNAGTSYFAISPSIIRSIEPGNKGSEFTRAVVEPEGIAAFDKTYYLDVADITGSYYVYCVAGANGYYNGWYSYMYVTNIACS